MPDVTAPSQAFKRSLQRQVLRYAVQIKHGPQIIKLVVVRLDIDAGQPPPAIRRQLDRKIFDFIKAAYPNLVGLGAVVCGRVDLEF